MDFRTLLAAAIALGAVATGAEGHRLWIEPSKTVLSGDENWVTFDAAESTDVFVPDHRALRIEQMQVTEPDGSAGKAQNASQGRYRLSFDVQLDKPGTWRIGFGGTNVGGTVRIDGQERRVGGFRGGPPPGAGQAGGGMPGMSGPGAGPGGPGGPGGGNQGPPPIALKDIPAGATDLKLTEMVSRNEVFVTTGAPTKIRTTGKGLELDPITHPDELVQNEVAQFRFLIDDKPAPGLKVILVAGQRRFRNADDAVEVTTGADGVARVRWPGAGLYWLNAVATDDHPAEPRAAARRMSYTATLEVLTP